jgi:hypothetical protein
MGSLEIYYGTIAFIVTLIGIARGYSKELGSTMIILVAIFLLMFTENRLNPILLSVRNFLWADGGLPETLFLSLVYQLFFVAAVFAGYSGRTITFGGTEVRAPQRNLLNLLIGGINGYLIAGTLWYYQHAYGYPFDTWGWTTQPLSGTAEVLVSLIPQYLLPTPSLWMIPIAVLLLLRVRG